MKSACNTFLIWGRRLNGMIGMSLNARQFCIMHTTGFPEVGVTPLIAHISLMPGPIITPFDSMKVKIG